MYPNTNSIVSMSRPRKALHRRMVMKNGLCNVVQSQSNRQRFGIFSYEKLVDSSWAFTLSTFLTVLFLSWTCFAIFYWLICFTHGDFEPNHLPEFQHEYNFKPCIYDMRDFSSAFLFSMEAQHTVGYGIKAPSSECAEALFVNTIHCIIGFVMQGFMAAIIFSKMTKPRVRSQTLMFSKKIAISLKNRKLCLMFRVGDIRLRHIVDSKVRAFVVKTIKTKEEEILPYAQRELNLCMDGCSDSIFFNWPIIMHHTIDENSPLYYLSPSDLCQQKFEIVVVIEGTDENTGQMTQAKSSYMPNEILWGYRFENMIIFNNYREEYEVDFSKFDVVAPVNTPLCSAVYNDQYNTMQNSKVCSTRLTLDFTPRHSLGEIPEKHVAIFKEVARDISIDIR
ncbi:inward rectifier potassium channel 4-like isoform X2 [Euwallacea fornicatus]|uniref:inward rectifier potassium channel 4-like isoform X2 n=1 Tax=Euwallacea fornicatus TaxID=995702 RepID=UPI00338FEE52